MRVRDMRFDMSVMKNLIGKRFQCYKCDAFDFTNSVTQIVGLYIDDKIYTITNMQETVDYYGNEEDISVCRFTQADDEAVRSAFLDTEMIQTPIEGIISKIAVVDENQKVFTGDEDYDVWLTRGILFEVDGREISFEKDIVPFSEEIIIRRGYRLLDKFSDEKEFLEGWDKCVKAACRREIKEVLK